jgi:hypothetical protein
MRLRGARRRRPSTPVGKLRRRTSSRDLFGRGVIRPLAGSVVHRWSLYRPSAAPSPRKGRPSRLTAADPNRDVARTSRRSVERQRALHPAVQAMRVMRPPEHGVHARMVPTLNCQADCGPFAWQPIKTPYVSGDRSLSRRLQQLVAGGDHDSTRDETSLATAQASASEALAPSIEQVTIALVSCQGGALTNC